MARKVAQATNETPKERIARYKATHGTFFYRPYPWQERLLEAIRGKNTVAAVSSNKIGKTATVANIGISWCLGYEPWTQGYRGDDFVEEGGQRYRVSSLGIKPPVNIIVTGEDWKLHIGKTLIPEFVKWAPLGWYKTKKNEQGVEYMWEWLTKSTMTFMSYSQDDDLFESFRIQGAIMDEPPPQTKFKAMSRGLLLDQGKTLLSLTPLKEAWILDEIVLSGRRDIGIIKDLKITDNPDLYNSDMSVLRKMGMDDGQIKRYWSLQLYEDEGKEKPVSDKGYAAERYLEEVVSADALAKVSELKVKKFIADIDPSDVPPRVFGQFKSLVGRVLKEFDENVHVIKSFEVPTDWPVVAMIDFHLSKPQAISYWATDKREIRYCVGETWKNLHANGIADDVIRHKRLGWRIDKAFIDPLSKGDTGYLKNILGDDIDSTYTTLEQRFSSEGITLAVGSKDKDSGIHNMREWLKGPNQMPCVFVFDTCERHLYEVRRWVYDDDGKPIKENDDMMENWYRFTLTGTKYEDFRVNPLPKRQHLGSGTWMGA